MHTVTRVVGTTLACSRGNWMAAREPLTRSLELKRRLGMREKEALARLNLGEVEEVLGQWNRAERHYERALKILADVPEDARMLDEEIFGPVAPVKGFTSEDEAIAAANDTEYGLVAYVFTQDINRAFRVIERLDTGMIGFNQGMVSNAGAPFGGVKASGFGREGGPEGIQEYLDIKYVSTPH